MNDELPGTDTRAAHMWLPVYIRSEISGVWAAVCDVYMMY